MQRLQLLDMAFCVEHLKNPDFNRIQPSNNRTSVVKRLQMWKRTFTVNARSSIVGALSLTSSRRIFSVPVPVAGTSSDERKKQSSMNL